MRTAIRQGYHFTYVDNENESYSFMIRDPSFIARQFLDVTGQLKQQVWTESGWLGYWFRPRQCEVPAYCGEFGVCNEPSLPICSCLEGFKHRFEGEFGVCNEPSGGCVREDGLVCGGREKNQKMSF